jgi:hypothetical protein
MNIDRPPQSREELVEALGEIRNQGALDAVEEAELLRHFDDMQRDVKEEMARLEPEYRQRCEDDGKDAADRWLTETAEAIGRRYGEATRALTDRLGVVTGIPRAA